MQLKNVMKILINTLILIFLVSCSIDNRSIIDNKLLELNNEYNDLCSKPRNDKLKVKYQKLELEIIELENFLSSAANLSYEEQINLMKYFLIKLKSYKNLYDLVEKEKINCW